MVSKVAVIALVAIVAAPILLGYAFNIQTEEVSSYENDGTATNVTKLLENNKSYTYTDANLYSLNTNNLRNGTYPYPALPEYKSINSRTATPLQLYYGGTSLASRDDLTRYPRIIIDNSAAGTSTSNTFSITVTYEGSNTQTINNVTYAYWEKSLNKAYIVRGPSSGGPGYYIFDSPTLFQYSGSLNSNAKVFWTSMSGSYYVDISQGWRFPQRLAGTISPRFNVWASPSNAESLLLTINLDDAAENETSIATTIQTVSANPGLYTFYLFRVVEGSTVNWYISQSNNWIYGHQIPYNQDISNNTIQILIERSGYEVRYIGEWSNTVGEAAYYWNLKLGYNESGSRVIAEDNYITGFSMVSPGTPTNVPGISMRVDRASIISATISSIMDQTYNPAFTTGKENPSTTITNVTKYGPSITFGSNTYTVTDGSIRILGSRDIPVDGINFNSIPDGNGRYNNRIGNTVVSNTAQPATITLNGIWRAELSTDSQTLTTSQVTHWVPGVWAWNGIDVNFAMVGLSACAAAFIGLGVYGRRSGGKVGALMLVCAGGALVFLALL